MRFDCHSFDVWAAPRARRLFLGCAVGAGTLLGGFAPAQVVKAPRYQGGVDAPVQQVSLPPLPPAITPHGMVVEDVVVRVNDQIISRSDVERAQQQLDQEAAQNRVTGADLVSAQKNMLRDMIDQQLLQSRAKELGLTADAEVIRQLDEIRKQNKMDTLEDLEKAAKQQGVSFEDFKAQIRNRILTQQVVRDEVGRRLQLSPADEAKYYEEHKAEFTQPEQIRLSEILVPLPETASAAELAQAETKAKDLKAKVTGGADFAELAKKFSGGPSAAQGGDLGLFKRGTLAKVLEDQTFDLKAGASTEPIRTRQGFVILKVLAHDQPGPAPMTQVETQIQEALYMQAMQPALRTYLTKLREEAYIDVQPGFVDSGASGKETKPVYTAYAPPALKKKTEKQRVRFDRGGRYSSTQSKRVTASPDTTGTRTLTGADARNGGVDPATGLAVMVPTQTRISGGKAPKVARKEKVRFGQAPRNSLPGGGTDSLASDTSAVNSSGDTAAPVAAETAQSADLADNPLTPQAPAQTKTRFSARAKEEREKKARTLTAKQFEKATAKPIPMTAEEQTASKVQAAPLGLAGDTGKKARKPKKVKGGPKQRLEDKKPEPKHVDAPVEPTANPALAPTDATPASSPARPSTAAPSLPEQKPVPQSLDETTLPPVTQPAAGSPQPVPAAQPPGL